jgi:uncharacterized protein YecT (DUF1311 family)
MSITKPLAALAALGLIAGCAAEGAGDGEANNRVANTAAEAPAAKADEPREEAIEARAEERQDRPLPDYVAFRISDSERDARLSSTYNDCMQAAGSTADYRECSSAEFRRIEVQMEQALTRVEGTLSGPSRERLRSEQQRWRSGIGDLCRRELEEEGGEGGTMDLLTLDSCSLREVVRRTLWLESLR